MDLEQCDFVAPGGALAMAFPDPEAVFEGEGKRGALFFTVQWTGMVARFWGTLKEPEPDEQVRKRKVFFAVCDHGFMSVSVEFIP